MRNGMSYELDYPVVRGTEWENWKRSGWVFSVSLGVGLKVMHQSGCTTRLFIRAVVRPKMLLFAQHVSDFIFCQSMVGGYSSFIA